MVALPTTRTKWEMAHLPKEAQDKAFPLLKKQADDMQLAMEELQLKLAIATGDQETKERIETARLTRDAARLSLDKEKTVLDINLKGGPNGYQ